MFTVTDCQSPTKCGEIHIFKCLVITDVIVTYQRCTYFWFDVINVDCFFTSSASINYESNANYNSFDLFFEINFISLDPTHMTYITFPLMTTEITEPRLALRWISFVNYSPCILFLRVQTCSPIIQINNSSLSATGMFYIYQNDHLDE